MGVPVDYRCEHCGGTSEQRVESPPPQTVRCPACGSSARRRFSVFGVRRPPPAVADRPAPPALAPCMRHPDVPALCHLSPSVARAWVARARNDGRSLERELAAQEQLPPHVASERVQAHINHRGHHHGSTSGLGIEAVTNAEHGADSAAPAAT